MKEELIKSFNTFSQKVKAENVGIILFLEGIHSERELIANPDGLNKIEYIKTAYNDNLMLKNNDKIKIVNYQFFNNNNPVDIHINLGRKIGE